MSAQDEDPKETARALYRVLKDVMALFENGQIVRNTEHDADFEWLQKQAGPPRGHGIGVDVGQFIRQGDVRGESACLVLHTIMTLAKADAALEALRKDYDES